jgi:DEAD/DEAH box helicase domain-containing protein
MRKIFFDIETSNLFSEVGTNNPADLTLSVICIYDSKTETFSHYLAEDLPKLWPIIESADILVGYNSDHFDIPLLNKYYPGDLYKIKSLDILKEIKQSYGRRMKLDQIAQGTLGINKIGDGLEAIRWWREGKKDKVIEYCISDVQITKDVYEYARANNHLKFSEGGEILTIPLKTDEWEIPNGSTLTHTLPF